MRSLYQPLLIIGLISYQAAFSQSTTIVSLASSSSGEKFERDAELDYSPTDFMIKSATIELIKVNQTKVALDKTNSRSLKEWTATIIKDHTTITKRLGQLAYSHHVSLPHKLNNKWEDLVNATAEEFDRKFISQMVYNLEAEIKLLRFASECEDRWVRLFAAETLPVVENHLSTLKALRNN